MSSWTTAEIDQGDQNTVGLEVTVPVDWQPGKKLGFEHLGKRYEVPVPEGNSVGSKFRIYLRETADEQQTSGGNAGRTGAGQRRKRKAPGDGAKKGGKSKKPTAADRKIARAAADDLVMRETLRNFFGSTGRGRTPEYIRRMMDGFLTVFAANPVVDGKMLDRYLGFHAGRMEARLDLARRRVEHNSQLPPNERQEKWKWWDPTATRKDAFGPELCEEAAEFWRNPLVSKRMGSKSTKKQQYRQNVILKVAHQAFLKHKQRTDPNFKCGLNWFTRQRPDDVKKLVLKPAGVKKFDAGDELQHLHDQVGHLSTVHVHQLAHPDAHHPYAHAVQYGGQMHHQ